VGMGCLCGVMQKFWNLTVGMAVNIVKVLNATEVYTLNG
jgi:hypothetical protein